MVDIPEIARKRLGARAAPEEHPGPDLLTAFIERSLGARERGEVLEHLAICQSCRDVLALAVEAAPVGEPAAGERVPAWRPWRRSWAFRWGVPVVATAALVAFAVLIGPRPPIRERGDLGEEAAPTRPQREEAPGRPAGESTAPREPKGSRPSGGEPGKSGGARRETDSTRVVTRKATAQEATGSVEIRGRMEDRAPAEFAGQVDGVSVEDVKTGRIEGPPSAPPVLTRAPEETRAAELAREKGAPTSSALPQEPPVTRWTVSEAGTLLRSIDGGQAWSEAGVGAGVAFLVVASRGQEVWAGGTSGALFHSGDGGTQWLQVGVHADGRSLSGDIILIELTDARTGAVITSTGERWTTDDAGLNWRLP